MFDSVGVHVVVQKLRDFGADGIAEALVRLRLSGKREDQLEIGLPVEQGPDKAGMHDVIARSLDLAGCS